jgi:hypothetical protein
MKIVALGSGLSQNWMAGKDRNPLEQELTR